MKFRPEGSASLCPNPELARELRRVANQDKTGAFQDHAEIR